MRLKLQAPLTRIYEGVSDHESWSSLSSLKKQVVSWGSVHTENHQTDPPFSPSLQLRIQPLWASVSQAIKWGWFLYPLPVRYESLWWSLPVAHLRPWNFILSNHKKRNMTMYLVLNKNHSISKHYAKSYRELWGDVKTQPLFSGSLKSEGEGGLRSWETTCLKCQNLYLATKNVPNEPQLHNLNIHLFPQVYAHLIQQEQEPTMLDRALWLSLHRLCSAMSSTDYSLAIWFAPAHYILPTAVPPPWIMGHVQQRKNEAEVFIFQKKTFRTQETEARPPLGNSDSTVS